MNRYSNNSGTENFKFSGAWLFAAGLVLCGGNASAEAVSLSYDCERGVEIPVVYVNDSDPALAILYVEGRMITLQQARSGSGARYAWPSDGANYEWWEHQGNAQLRWIDTSAGTETEIYQSCVPRQ